MKKLIALILIAACIFAVVGCTSETPDTNDDGTTTTTTSTTKRGQIPEGEEPEKEDPKPTEPVLGNVSVTLDTPFTDTFDLTAEGTKYWEFYGQVEQNVAPNEDYKAIDSEDKDIIDTFFQSTQTHWDNKGTITWTDGTNAVTATTTHGMNTQGTVYVDVTTTGCTEIKLFVGVWNAINVMTIADENEVVLYEDNVVEAGGDASICIVTIDLSQYQGSILSISFATTATTAGGNVSLSAVAVK